MQKDKIQGRAPHPRRSRLRAAVKAEWARWSTCHLSWLSMPMPGAVTALGMPRNRGGQVCSGQPLESNQDLSYPEEPHSQSLETAAPKHTRRASPRPRPTEDGFCPLLFQKVPEATDFPRIYHLMSRSGSQKKRGSTFFSVSR
ncbi:uncharacterized protein LOC143696282 isoform X3 [Agelaius phoeniceus]|uniref:uncharacterized protein LOC143696282 isoform X3 n=1 Tax=Agelaius phoeniceus TaxID=39638 RepID=UPI004054B850